ncbi:hypothetical protein JTE90_004295 [Oedothorax gibbosus]|uniref:Uncharacterized protein n=1 Tax=Oedothorax gibbosus TaxID=931172 RepID=A0AAV6VK21_9ARAC|nr:hypothetical protein JTE90_004295 [Oedothorax gibbosus]
MNTCADISCTCGKHECFYKRARNPIIPIVVKAKLPREIPQEQEMHCSQANKPSTIKHVEPYFNKNEDTFTTNCNIEHPSHIYKKYQHCHGHHICPDIVPEVRSCDHDHYIPMISQYPKPVCHPERPTVIELQKITESENKDCKKCSEVFANLDSLWKRTSPPRRQAGLVEEYHDISCHCDHDVALECCCRCCTCRGCPTCESLQNCHPCRSYPGGSMIFAETKILKV